jgi:UDP-glucose 4-epimerase
MRTAVFGGGGFLGRRLVAALLEQGDEVLALDAVASAEGFPVEPVLVEDFAAVRDALTNFRAEAVVNLAYISGAACAEQPYAAQLVNQHGFLNVLEGARSVGAARIVYASSIAAYGPSQELYGDRPITEQDACAITDHSLSYGVTKAANDFLAHEFATRYDLQVCGIRPGIIIGPGRKHGLTTWGSDIAAGPATGQPARIPLRADQQVSVVDVDDVARLFVRALHADHLPSPLYNTGGHSVPVARLADAVRAIEPTARHEFSADAEPLPFVWNVSGRRAASELGFEVRPLDESLRRHMNTTRRVAGLEPRY